MVSRSVDSVDRRIIGVLQHEARLSWRELGERVHLAPTSVADRVRVLERTEVIRGYRALVDPASLGRTVRAVIGIELPAQMQPETFEARLADREEIALATYVTGNADYIVIGDFAGPDGLDAFLRWLKSELGVAKTESKLVLRTVVE